MFPCDGAQATKQGWLGYGRGDVPEERQWESKSKRVGLRARGCSDERTARTGGEAGWATGAGMFRGIGAGDGVAGGLGYGRGDVPVGSFRRMMRQPVGLRARGCSWEAPADFGDRRGWATGAGMFLPVAWADADPHGLGYGRGDVPANAHRDALPYSVGLRARGCS